MLITLGVSYIRPTPPPRPGRRVLISFTSGSLPQGQGSKLRPRAALGNLPTLQVRGLESSHSAGERLGSQLPASGKVSLRWGFESHGPFFHYYCSKIYITQKNESHSVVSNSLQPHGLYSPWNSLGQNTGVGSLSLLQGIFPTQGSNPGFRHCRWILYQLSHKGSPHNANCTVSTMSKYPSQWH